MADPRTQRNLPGTHTSSAALVLLPGLGADAGLYQPQIVGLGTRIIVPPWLRPTCDNESLESYAQRLGDHIRALPSLSRPFYLGGLSLGGIIAAEVAECCGHDVAGLFLIGACLDASEIPAIWKGMALAGQHLPDGLCIGLLNRIAPAIIAWWQELGRAEADLFSCVYSRGSVRQLKWAADAMRRWHRSAVPRCPVFRAHGRRDDIVPIREDRLMPGIDLVIPDGRHLISLTHADAVNQWLLERMDSAATASV